MAEEHVSLDDLIATVERRAGDDPLARLQAASVLAGELGDVSDQLLDHFVTAARASGSSWAQIGERFGMSKQAAQQRFFERGSRGMGPFRRLTPKARDAVAAAQEEARELGHGRLGTEHLLLGVLREQDRPSVAALAGAGVTADAARARVKEALGAGDRAETESVHFTRAAKRALAVSMGGARWMGHREVAPEHLLLAILRDPAGGGAKIMHELAAEPEKLRDEILGHLFGEDEIPQWVRDGELPPWMHRRGRGSRGGRGPRSC